MLHHWSHGIIHQKHPWNHLKSLRDWLPCKEYVIQLRKYGNPVELYRRFMGFLISWKKYSDTDEARLLISLLNSDRNTKKSIKLFLKLRKILLKSINQKILQEINLTHGTKKMNIEDAVTIVHTMNNISTDQKRILTKKVN